MQTVDEKQAAKIIGVSARTLQKWRQQRRGPNYIKLGVKVAYPVACLTDYLAGRIVMTDEPQAA